VSLLAKLDLPDTAPSVGQTAPRSTALMNPKAASTVQSPSPTPLLSTPSAKQLSKKSSMNTSVIAKFGKAAKASPSAKSMKSGSLESANSEVTALFDGDLHNIGSGSKKTGASILIMRSLPDSFDQDSAKKWVDSAGYAELYDFFLWFPAKKTSRPYGNAYAFVHFSASADARRFYKECHLCEPPGNEPQTSISVAVVKR